MVLSKTCETAVKSIVYLASHVREAGGIPVSEISKEIGENTHTISKVLQVLSRQKLVTGKPGPIGGYFITPQQLNYTLLDVVLAIDGKKIKEHCVLGLTSCNSKKPCPLHKRYKHIRSVFTKLLSQTEIGAFRQDLWNEKIFLRN